jgi:hypothetical protein
LSRKKYKNNKSNIFDTSYVSKGICKNNRRLGNCDSNQAADDKRPKSKTDQIALEGMEEDFSFTLHDDAALGLSTYIVEDMIVESVSSREGDSMLVFTNFGGSKNDEAFASIYSPHMDMTVDELTDFAVKTISWANFEIVERSEEATNRFEWSENEFSIMKQDDQGGHIIGTVSIFERNGHSYMFKVQYPEDYSEGMVPRVMKVVEDIQWYGEK